MGNTQTSRPLSNLLRSEDFTIRLEGVTADTYTQGDLLTYDGEYFSKASLASGDNHTESYAVVYDGGEVATDGGKVAIILEGVVYKDLLSADYQALSDDDRKAVNKELVAKNIIVENN